MRLALPGPQSNEGGGIMGSMAALSQVCSSDDLPNICNQRGAVYPEEKTPCLGEALPSLPSTVHTRLKVFLE